MGTKGQDAGRDTEDYALRMRHADYLASAGVGVDRIAIEVLYLLPPGFVKEYTVLFHSALNIGEDGNGIRNDAQTELGKVSGANSPNTGSRGGSRMSSGGHTEIGSGTGRGGGSGGKKGIFGIRNEEMLGQKDAVDRVLRKLARKMRNAGEGNERGKGMGMDSKCGYRLKKGGNGGTEREMKREYRAEKLRTLDGLKTRAGFEMVPAGCGKYVEGEWKYCPWCGWKKSGLEGAGRKELDAGKGTGGGAQS